MRISVIVPVGPYTRGPEHLTELLDSLATQTSRPEEVVLIDDAAHLQASRLQPAVEAGLNIRLIRNAWNLGEAASRNIGIAHAASPWVFDACHDDILMPDCLEAASQIAESAKDEYGYYYVPLGIGPALDEIEHVQTEMGAQALYSKNLWAHLGGYPRAGGIGLADIFFEDLVLLHSRGGLDCNCADDATGERDGSGIWAVPPLAPESVAAGHLYFHRQHEENVVATTSGGMKDLARQVSNENGRTWRRPLWASGFPWAREEVRS